MRTLIRLLGWLTSLLLPFALTLLAGRLLLTHAFLEVEYRTPGFPADEYGFSFSERMELARLALDYLTNDAGPEFLGGLVLPDGRPAFNSRELSHMQDVKAIIRPLLPCAYALWAVLLGLAGWAGLGGWWGEYRRAVQRGGWLMVGLVAAIAAFASINFWGFFTAFHALFFTGDSWLFLYSDTLIRLFPMRFWQDLFLAVGLFDLSAGLALGWGLRRKPK